MSSSDAKEVKRDPNHGAPVKSTLPPMEPGATCNARLARSAGYCDNPAGAATNHEGTGRCWLHGGLGGRKPRDPIKMFRASGLGPIIDMAEQMTHDDQEYLYEVSNSALVVSRAAIVARMQDPNVSAKELSDLTMAMSRIDTILSKLPLDEDPDRAPNSGKASALDEEAQRLVELEKTLGKYERRVVEKVQKQTK